MKRSTTNARRRGETARSSSLPSASVPLSRSVRPGRRPRTLEAARTLLPTSEAPWKPTPAQLEAARSKVLRDVIAPGLDVLFCGINPGLYSAATGHHFARPGNRFWPTLHAAGFTPRLFTGFDDRSLLDLGLGITNLCARTTGTADELTRDELLEGGRILRRKVLRFQPRFLAVVGFTAYRIAFDDRTAAGGRQPEPIGGTTVWLLPNPSGLNAHHQPAQLRAMFAELRAAL